MQITNRVIFGLFLVCSIVSSVFHSPVFFLILPILAGLYVFHVLIERKDSIDALVKKEQSEFHALLSEKIKRLEEFESRIIAVEGKITGLNVFTNMRK